MSRRITPTASIFRYTPANAKEAAVPTEDYRKVLITPNGDEYVARSPREANDLMYGSGYREKTGTLASPPAKAPPPKTGESTP